MPKIHTLASLLLALAILMSSAFADSVTLKSGEHLEGKITSETDRDITIQVKVSAGITDERVIPKAQIEKTEKTSPELEAYRSIAAIQLGKDSMNVAQYDQYIQALEAYVSQYPASVRIADVQTRLNAFLDEKKRVEDGEIKMDGQWIPKAEVRKEKVQIGGQLTFTYMKSQAADGQYIPALNTFAVIEKNFAGAAVMPEAIDLAQRIVVKLEATVLRAIPEQKARAEQQKKDLAAAGPVDRETMTAAIKRQQDAEDAQVQASTSGWPPFYPDNEKSLTALMTRLKSEGPRLATLPIEKMRDSLQETLEAKQGLASGDINGAVEKLKDATLLWPTNELAVRLTKEALEMQKGAAASAAATPAPASAAETSAQATPRMKHGAPIPSADGPAASATAPASAASASPAPAPAATTVASVKAAASDSDDDQSLVTIPRVLGLVAVLALLLIGANMYMKKKKRQAEEAGN